MTTLPPPSSSSAHSSATPETKSLSITDFLTDGSLAGLCGELASLTGVSIDLLDLEGRGVVPSGQEGQPWRVVESVTPQAPGAICFPLRVGGHRIGSLLVSPGSPALGKEPRQSLERVVGLLAGAAAELCEHELEVRDKVRELSALFRLTSLLAQASGMERVLEVALDAALDALGLDAGSIMLLKEDADGVVTGTTEDDLDVATSRHLSKEWLLWPQSLSKDRLFDRMALAGEVVVSEDLSEDPRVQIRDKAAAEGLVSAIHAGVIFQNRPLGVLRLYARRRQTFSDFDRRMVRSIAQQAAVAIEQARLLRLQAEEQRIQRQLQLAADVQRRMLPSRVPQVPGVDLAARYVPSFELGGDFYDFIELNGHLGLVVGDVVGKGVAAALLMAAVRASLRAHAQDVYDLDTVVARVNHALCRDTLDNEFATLWYGVLDPATLRLTYCNAGHEPPIIVRVPAHRPPTAADIDELSVGGMVVGIDRSQRYQRAVYDLHDRDVLIAYTDGLTDAASFDRKKFGKKRVRETLLSILAAEPEAPASRILDLLHWEVRKFTGLSNRVDDETIVVMRISRTRK